VTGGWPCGTGGAVQSLGRRLSDRLHTAHCCRVLDLDDTREQRDEGKVGCASSGVGEAILMGAQ